MILNAPTRVYSYGRNSIQSLASLRVASLDPKARSSTRADSPALRGYAPVIRGHASLTICETQTPISRVNRLVSHWSPSGAPPSSCRARGRRRAACELQARRTRLLLVERLGRAEGERRSCQVCTSDHEQTNGSNDGHRAEHSVQRHKAGGDEEVAGNPGRTWRLRGDLKSK